MLYIDFKESLQESKERIQIITYKISTMKEITILNQKIKNTQFYLQLNKKGGIAISENLLDELILFIYMGEDNSD